MKYRTLGRTGVSVSEISLGAGPVPELLTGGDLDRQISVVQRALELGINWIDTAATYGDGKSEANIGRAIKELGAPLRLHVATKVRLAKDDLSDIRSAVRRSMDQSLERLGLTQVTLLQLHNSITLRRDDEPTSITVGDVLGPNGVAAAMEELRAEGRIRFLGLTGIGTPQAMREVVESNRFDTMQVPFNILNPSAGNPIVVTADPTEANYGNIIADCSRYSMGVFAIRVFAGGAIFGAPPSKHTLTTKFFPLALYERDRERAAALATSLSPNETITERALRFVLDHPAVSSAIVGFSTAAQIDELVRKVGDRCFE